MTRDEFRVVEAQISAYWPNTQIPQSSFDAWFEILASLDLQLTTEAVKAMYVEGRDFPPNAGQIHRVITDAKNNLPDWDEVLAEIRAKLKELNRDHRFSSSPALQFHTPDVEEWSSDEVASLVHRSGGINSWREALASWCGGTDDTTFIAQQRNIWKSSRERSARYGRLTAIGAASLRELESGDPQTIGEILQITTGEKQC